VKVKKKKGGMVIHLKENIDIASTLGALKKPQQVHIGFALETHDEVSNAKEKLEEKNFDMIVLNSLKDAGAGFKYDTNKVTLFFKNGEKEVTELLPKKQIAALIVENIKKLFNPA
jgi:phosphopantothenoylcysteine decarboxylase/phosphopantothenate--cysteine ligase